MILCNKINANKGTFKYHMTRREEGGVCANHQSTVILG